MFPSISKHSTGRAYYYVLLYRMLELIVWHGNKSVRTYSRNISNNVFCNSIGT